MNIHFVPMDEESAQAVARWHFDGEYSFYDFNQDPEDMADLMDSRGWKDRYWAVRDEGNGLVGFFCFETQGDAIEIGLGLRPDRTGKGLGESYVKAGLEFARMRFRPERFIIQVAKFNRRAIHVYEKPGFHIDKVFLQKTNGGEFEFISMVRNA